MGEVFPINSLPSCQLVDGGIYDILKDADIKHEACRRYYERVDADILFFFSDIAIQAEAMGARISLPADAMPSIADPARSIQTPNPDVCPRMRVNSQVTSRLKACFPQKLISTMVYGPATVAGQLMGEQTFLKKIIHDPNEVKKVLSQTELVAKNYADYLLNAGADVLWISDPLAALLPPKGFWEFGGQYLGTIFNEYASTPSIIHICGDITPILTQVAETGVSAISFDQCMDLTLVEDDIPDHITIIGNLDPTEKIEQASPQQVEAAVIDLANMMGAKPNFVMSSGCALPPSTPLLNVQIFMQTARQALNELKPHAKALNGVRHSVFEGEKEDTVAWVDKAIRNDVPALTVTNAGLMRAVRKGSAAYDARRRYLPDVLLMADAFYAGYKHIKHQVPHNKGRDVDIILGTVKGDYHEIGKDLVKIFLEINGFHIIDLGVNVEPEDFIRTALSTKAPIIGLSAFITSVRKQLKTVIQLAAKEGLDNTGIVVGGAAVSSGIAADIGAHGYAKNAVEAIQVVKKLFHPDRGGL